MLTCFKENTLAMNFYFRAGYSIDSNSPSMLQMNVPYDILSKILI